MEGDAVKRILKGAIDIHAHTGPSLFPRVVDSIEYAQQAKAYGMRAIVLKCHHGITADRATLVAKVVPGIDVFGSVTLNQYVGGINPYAVDAAIDLGAKMIWMPSNYAQHHIDIYGAPEWKQIKQTTAKKKLAVKGVTIFDGEGKLTPQTMEVLELIKSAGIALSTGHISKEETKALVDAAGKMGLEKIVVTHITQSELWKWTVEEQEELIRKGAIIEHCAILSMENNCLIPVREVAKLINAVGYENLVISSDGGQLRCPSPPDALKIFVSELLAEGLKEQQLEHMLKEIPARILGLN
jgi:hypothetical protein